MTCGWHGRADVMIDRRMHVWDCAALLPVIEEAGGRFSDWRGERTIRGPIRCRSMPRAAARY